MKRTWLVIDVSYLCHRSWHTMGDLSWKGKATGVIFGFLQSITGFKSQFATDYIAFCFESPHLFRKDIYPDYKAKRRVKKRREWTEQEAQSYRSLQKQIAQLRTVYLPKIGFNNILCVDGFESDDLMASIAFNCPSNEEVVLITADTDLLQCLSPNVCIFSPQAQKLHTYEKFVANYGFHPRKWAMVKAIAGCSTDEVKGVPGVGDVGATRFVQKRLPAKTLQYQAITSEEGRAIVRRNRKLVQLPFEGCPVFELVEDEISKEGWQQVCGQLGMRSIAQRPPMAPKTTLRL